MDDRGTLSGVEARQSDGTSSQPFIEKYETPLKMSRNSPLIHLTTLKCASLSLFLLQNRSAAQPQAHGVTSGGSGRMTRNNE